jgi:hypothetical protein
MMSFIATVLAEQGDRRGVAVSDRLLRELAIHHLGR